MFGTAAPANLPGSRVTRKGCPVGGPKALYMRNNAVTFMFVKKLGANYLVWFAFP